MFVDINVLITAQGAQLDQAVGHVTKAADDTEKGTKHLDEAIHKQKKNKKKLLIILVLGLIVVGLAIGIPGLLKKF